MTERAHGTVGGDDCQNRAARRYEKCSYLWHYFRRFEPFFRPDPFLARCRDAPRKSLSRAPFSSSSPSTDISSPPPSESSSLRSPTAWFHGTLSSFLLPLLARPPRISASARSPPTPYRSGAPPPSRERARTAGRFCPHRRGHHFNVTLIKSNNQYLPRKKF